MTESGSFAGSYSDRRQNSRECLNNVYMSESGMSASGAPRTTQRQLRFSTKDDAAVKAINERPERWMSRRNISNESSTSFGSKVRKSRHRHSSEHSTGSRNRRGHNISLKKQGSLFATADEDIVEEQQSRHLYIVYKLEQWLSNRNAQYLSLVIVGLFLILIGGLMWMAVQDTPEDPDEQPHGAFFEGIWVAWTFVADPGTHSTVVSPEQRMVGSLISVLGIIFFAGLLGVVVDAIRNKMDLLRQGRSRVVERNHSLILGWTEKSILLIEELCVANQSEGGGVIVVMAKNGKQDMEGELRVQLPKRHLLGSKVVFRSGSPLLTHDLVKVGAHKARSIIILASDSEPNQADAEILRCILVLRTLPFGLQGYIVAEVRDISNEPLLKMVGGSVTETVPSHDILGRLMLMAGRSPGLAKVYESLLGFEGDEFYMWEWPELQGMAWLDLIGRFPDAIPIGIRSPHGSITLNPQPDTVVGKGDKIIVIAEDDDTYRPEPPTEIDEGNPPIFEEPTLKPEKIFIAGWRRDISDIFVYLDNMVVKGSELHMMTHCVSLEERNARLEDEGLDVGSLHNATIKHHFGNTTVRRKLEALALGSFSSCMIFADQAFEMDTMHADSHSLATLLLIRDTQMNQYEALHGQQNAEELVAQCPIVCEILDPRTQKTIAGSIDMQHSSEFCHSNLMVAQIMAMVSENRTVKDLLDEMLGYKGCSVAVFPATRFTNPLEKCSFWVVAKRAANQHMVLLGYNIRASIDPPHINPRDKTAPKLWDDKDLVALVPAKRPKARLREGQSGAASQHFRRAGLFPHGAGEHGTLDADEAQGRGLPRQETGGFFGETPADDVAPMEVAMEPRMCVEGAQVAKEPMNDSEESLETKVLKLAESIGQLDDSERRRFGKILDGVRDVVGSLPTHGDVTTTRKRLMSQRMQPRNMAEAALHTFSTRCLCHQDTV
mmetsp:Transcript_47982/g.138923  ORF Transcript_47982/g.138923 Transcript_47982/m.138923 type:complete len:946 (-) Transcript_47982:108-2945(-)